MQMRTLGKYGPEVSALGLGCMGMSWAYGKGDDEESTATIHHFLDAGGNFLDTADMYGFGKNEELVGKAIKDRRNDVFLATKFANYRAEDGTVSVRGEPKYVKEACEASLRRLGVDHIDLYYQHRVDPNTPIEDTVGAMAELVKEGKVRFLGLSEASPATIRRARNIHSITALQTEYSLWYRDVEEELLPLCREFAIGFVPYSPLGRGLLTGQIKSYDDFEETDGRRNHPRFQGENFQKNLDLVKQVEDLAQAKGATPSQIALAWLLAQGDDVVPIPGTKSRKRLDENLGALDVTLSQDDLTRLEEIFKPGSGAGQRYPEQAMRALNK